LIEHPASPATQGADPNDFADLAELERRLLTFQARHEQTAGPFDWRYTRSDLDRLLRRLTRHQPLTHAA
jgi:hypothetical protein